MSLSYVWANDLLIANSYSDYNHYLGAAEACQNSNDLYKTIHIIHLLYRTT